MGELLNLFAIDTREIGDWSYSRNQPDTLKHYSPVPPPMPKSYHDSVRFLHNYRLTEYALVVMELELELELTRFR